MSFLVNREKLGDIKVSGIKGSRVLGHHRLSIEFEFRIKDTSKNEMTIFLLGGELGIAGNGPEAFRAVRLIPTSECGLVILSKKTQPDNQVLEADLDSRTLEALEEIRDGGDLDLQIRIFGIGIAFNSFFKEVLGQIDRYSVNKGVWINLLEEMGYNKFILLEIPIPDQETAPKMAEAVQHLSDAQHAMLDRRYCDSVRDCRLALDAITKALGDKPLKAKELKRLLDNTPELDKPDRIRLIRRALYVFSCAAHHDDEVCRKFDWDRNDSIAMISMVATLVKWAS